MRSKNMLHELKATPRSVHWGYFDAGLEPALKVHSGDVVKVETLAGKPELFNQNELDLLYNEVPTLKQVYENVREEGPHILTGPIHVREAKQGDVLAVRLRDITPVGSFGYNLILPSRGALPEDFPHPRTKVIKYDSERENALFSSSIKVPLRPFFGVQGVAPSASVKRISSRFPGVHGGNLDNRELIRGSTIYLPVHTEGAMYSVGDGHTVQGDGEASLTALEGCMKGVLEFEIRSDLSLTWPMAETDSHIISMGFHSDLDEAAKIALRNMIGYLCDKESLSAEDAYSLSSICVNLHVTQLVNDVKGIHALLPKSIFSRRRRNSQL